MCLKHKLLLFSFVILAESTFFASYTNACARTNKKFYVEMFGAVGDGETNDIAAFQALARAVNANGGGVVVFPKERVFSISIEEDFNSGHRALPIDGAIALKFEHCKNVQVDLNGSTIQLTPNHSTKYDIFLFFDCASFSLSNGKIVGDAVGHDYTPVLYYGKEEKSSHEWGYGVHVQGSKGEIRDMDISRMTGDGIYYGSTRQKDVVYHAKIVVNKCFISFCRRNGISCDASSGFLLRDSKISHIGDWEISSDMPVAMTGCMPKSGIDFEYEGKTGDVGDITVSRCVFGDCTKFCIIASNVSKPDATRFVISDCEFFGSTVHTINLTSREKKEIKNCRFSDAGAFFGDSNVCACVFEMGALVNYVNGTSFIDCEFIGHLEKVDDKHGCFMGSINLDKTRFERCKFKNIKGYNNRSPASQGFSGYIYPLNIDFVGCVFENCSFVVGQQKHESRLAFYDCTLRNGCLIHNLGTEAITMEDSELINVESYVEQRGRFVLDRCIIVQDEESLERPFLLFGAHRLNKCNVIDRVGITSATIRNYGIKEYKIEASDSDIILENDENVTKGLSLKGGTLSGVIMEKFQGTQEKTVFK